MTCAWIALLGGGATKAFAEANPYNSLTLSWIAPGDDGAAGQVSAYELSYSDAPPGGNLDAWWNEVPFSRRITLFAPLAAAGIADSVVVTGLTQGTTYYFVLLALDEAANSSGFSNVASATTRSCGAPRSAPASFGAAVDSATIRVAWEAAPDSAARALNLYRADGSTGEWALLTTLPLDATQYRDAAIDPGVVYRYRAAYAGPEIQGVLCEGPYTPQATAAAPDRRSASASATSGTVHVFPNPAASASIQVSIDVIAPTPLPVRLRLFDVNGRWLATIAEESYPPGRSVITWNRTARNGSKLAPGYYELLGTIGATRVRERLVLLP